MRAMPSMMAAVVRPDSRWPAELAKATSTPSVEQKPAVSSPSAASTKAPTRSARSSGSACAVASSQWSTPAPAAGGARPGQPGSTGRRRAASVAEPTRRASASSSVWLPVASATRPSSATRRWTRWAASATFWWMKLVAKRVSASVPLADGDLGLGVGSHAGQDALADVEQHVAHPLTPTRTPRKRHGTAGWPVWPIWPGWPLPQFGVPQNVHSDSLPSMSSEPQKRGPMPV